MGVGLTSIRLPDWAWIDNAEKARTNNRKRRDRILETSLLKTPMPLVWMQNTDLKTGPIGLSCTLFRIKIFSKSVTDKIECQHRESDRGTRKE